MPAYYVGISLYGLRVFGDTSKPNTNAHVFICVSVNNSKCLTYG